VGNEPWLEPCPCLPALNLQLCLHQAVALLRIGQAAEEFDWLVEKMCEYLERGAALKSHIIRLRASPAKSTAVLLPILAQVGNSEAHSLC
jgi:hypothetical protein